MSNTTAQPSRGRIQQLSVFIENRTLELARIERLLDPDEVRICALSLISAGDHAVARLIVDRPAVAQLALEAEGFTVYRSELLGVRLPARNEPEVGIRRVLAALLSAEVRVEYLYTLITPIAGHPVLALSVDDFEVATRALASVKLPLVDQSDLSWGDAGTL